MNGEIALLLTQDGIVNGAVYALLALAIVLVFTVTRVLFLPQGEFIAYGGLSLATLQFGMVPSTVWALGVGALAVAAIDLPGVIRDKSLRRFARLVLFDLVLPAGIIATVVWLAPMKLPLALQILMSLAIVVPLGPIIYRLFFQPLANSSSLVLLIIAVGVHYLLKGLGQVFFGADGYRIKPFNDAQVALGPIELTGHSFWVLVISLVMMIALYAFFGWTEFGKALRATAMNRFGARLVGIRPAMAGRLAFTLAAFIGAVSGIFFVGLTTLYYDSGFLIGLNGFVGAVIGSAVSYPLAVLGAFIIGVLESFGAFWDSAYKDTIVFSLLIPVLLWLSLRKGKTGEEE